MISHGESIILASIPDIFGTSDCRSVMADAEVITLSPTIRFLAFVMITTDIRLF